MLILTVAQHPGHHLPTEGEVEEVGGVYKGVGAGSMKAIGAVEECIPRVDQLLVQQLEKLTRER